MDKLVMRVSLCPPKMLKSEDELRVFLLKNGWSHDELDGLAVAVMAVKKIRREWRSKIMKAAIARKKLREKWVQDTVYERLKKDGAGNGTGERPDALVDGRDRGPLAGSGSDGRGDIGRDLSAERADGFGGEVAKENQ